MSFTVSESILCNYDCTDIHCRRENHKKVASISLKNAHVIVQAMGMIENAFIWCASKPWYFYGPSEVWICYKYRDKKIDSILLKTKHVIVKDMGMNENAPIRCSSKPYEPSEVWKCCKYRASKRPSSESCLREDRKKVASTLLKIAHDIVQCMGINMNENVPI